MCPSRTGRRPGPGPVMVLVLAVAAGCGGGHDRQAARDAAGAVTRPGSGRGAGEASPRAGDSPGIQWQDPEPEGAQELAESVVGAPWNADKTTRLRMHITTLVSRTSGIGGFSTALVPEDAGLEDRLAALGAEETETAVTIRLPGAILFDFDSAAIRPDAERTLGEVVKVLRAYGDRPARIEGHTDSIASEAYNQELSERRAAAVARWLEGHGIAGRRLRVVGWGETRPIAGNDTPEGRQRNRRVEVVIEKGGG